MVIIIFMWWIVPVHLPACILNTIYLKSCQNPHSDEAHAAGWRSWPLSCHCWNNTWSSGSKKSIIRGKCQGRKLGQHDHSKHQSLDKHGCGKQMFKALQDSGAVHHTCCTDLTVDQHGEWSCRDRCGDRTPMDWSFLVADLSQKGAKSVAGCLVLWAFSRSILVPQIGASEFHGITKSRIVGIAGKPAVDSAGGLCCKGAAKHSTTKVVGQ